MKIGCQIIQDILPLYAENIASEETRAFIEEHLVECENCRSLLNGMKDPSDIPITLSAAPLIYLKKKMFRKRLTTVLVTAAVVLAIAISGFVYLTTPRYLPFHYSGAPTIMGEKYYGAGVVMVMDEKRSNGMVVCYFSDDVTGFNVESYLSEDGTIDIYDIYAWYTVWDKFTGRNSGQRFNIYPINERFIYVYFTQKEGEETIFIYGEAPFGSGVE
jgi:hypothetical protein